MTLADVRQSRLPQAIGLCAANTPEIAAAVNEATQNLLNASGETGWWGCWNRVVFNVSRTDPYITLPRKFARIINLDVCKFPIRIQNEFYEMLPDGIGLQPSNTLPDWCGTLAGYERGVYPTMVNLTATNQLIRAYATDDRDFGAKVLITGQDQNGQDIYSTLGSDTVKGIALELASPFATTSFIVTGIDSLQKDVTYGDVVIVQVDQDTGEEVTLVRLAPTETNPAYRRYYITKLPAGCCCTATGLVSVTALCKLDFCPIYLDTDQLIISNIPALINECQSIRFSQMDSSDAAQLEDRRHAKAIKLLQNELRHYMGEQTPAVAVGRFQGADLRAKGIGTLI